MIPDDPWASIDTPDSHDRIIGKRVDASLRWDFWWARDDEKRCLLVLVHGSNVRPEGRLPRFRGLEVISTSPDESGKCKLLLRLVDVVHRDIFHRLCLDIVAAAQEAETPDEAVGRFVLRTWRWHHLLRDGRDDRLGPQEQQGLIGELVVLERHILPVLGAHDSVIGWTGPLDTPKDFELGRVAIEAKARRGAATPWVSISSEHQLDRTGVDALFLHVAEVDYAPDGTAGALTVTDFVRKLKNNVVSLDPSCEGLLEERLTSRGFLWEHDYSDSLWTVGQCGFYEITDEFPCITPEQVPSGVSKVRYAISLEECKRHRIADEAVWTSLKELKSGD